MPASGRKRSFLEFSFRPIAVIGAAAERIAGSGCTLAC